MIIFFNASPLPDFWKKSSGEACYARGGQNLRILGDQLGGAATRGARSVECIHCTSPNAYFMVTFLSSTLRGILGKSS